MKNNSVPVKCSMRLTTLSFYGGALKYLCDSPRFEHKGNRSRNARTVTQKDYRINSRKDYRPWQKAQPFLTSQN